MNGIGQAQGPITFRARSVEKTVPEPQHCDASFPEAAAGKTKVAWKSHPPKNTLVVGYAWLCCYARATKTGPLDCFMDSCHRLDPLGVLQARGSTVGPSGTLSNLLWDA